METLSAGMQNLRVSQFFSDRRDATPDDLNRLRHAASFLSRSLAAVRYIEIGETEGLQEDSLRDARFARESVKQRLQDIAQQHEGLKDLLELLFASLKQYIDDPQSTALAADKRDMLEVFFGAVGEAMVGEATEPGIDSEDWPADDRSDMQNVFCSSNSLLIFNG